MPTDTILNKNLEKIISGLKKLDVKYQQSILAQINATLLLKKGIPKFSNPSKSVKPLTMAQIDSIKHKSRKQKANA